MVGFTDLATFSRSGALLAANIKKRKAPWSSTVRVGLGPMFGREFSLPAGTGPSGAGEQLATDFEVARVRVLESPAGPQKKNTGVSVEFCVF